MRLAAVLGACAAAACAAEPSTIVLENPQALSVDCATAPADLAARVWVSGYDEPVALSYDPASNTTSGSVDIASGTVRMLTIDWYRPMGRSDGVELVLAQARGELALVGGVQPTAEFAIDSAAIADTSCLDMRFDSFDGAGTVDLDGAIVPLCDLDDSCSGGDPATCTNLIETCSGGDPLDRTVEP
ncbi:MAG: hypothetical protein IT383_12000 [Deltaproteobacteria bacterium]|nr:hypothetical protein [Deltaproteobacteria bacterium]